MPYLIQWIVSNLNKYIYIYIFKKHLPRRYQITWDNIWTIRGSACELIAMSHFFHFLLYNAYSFLNCFMQKNIWHLTLAARDFIKDKRHGSMNVICWLHWDTVDHVCLELKMDLGQVGPKMSLNPNLNYMKRNSFRLARGLCGPCSTTFFFCSLVLVGIELSLSLQVALRFLHCR